MKEMELLTTWGGRHSGVLDTGESGWMCIVYCMNV